MASLEWMRAAGYRWVAETPEGDDCYEVFAAYVAFTCDESGVFDGDWSTEGLEDYEEARSELLSAVRAGRFPFVGTDGPVELFRAREGLDMCMGEGGRGLAVACDWHLYLGDAQLGYYPSADEAMIAAGKDAQARFGA